MQQADTALLVSKHSLSLSDRPAVGTVEDGVSEKGEVIAELVWLR